MAGAAIVLSAEQRSELEHAVRHHVKPYVRERASALLKLAAGQLYSTVASSGLLRRHSPDTLHDWVVRYQSEGMAGLYVRKGAGRKPAFSPSASAARAGQRSRASHHPT